MIGNGIQLSQSFEISVAAGEVEGWSCIRKYGICSLLNLATGIRDIWEYGSADKGDLSYTYPADGTAPIDTISSSSASDTGDISIKGLDAAGVEVVQVATLLGQTKVPLVTPLWRCPRMWNAGTSAGADISAGFAGDIYAYEDTVISGGIPTDKTKVRSFIRQGDNQTLMALDTVPAGKRGYLMWHKNAIVKKGTASALTEMWTREYGKVFRLQDSGSVSANGSSGDADIDPVIQVFPPMTDILMRVDVDTNATGIAGRFSLLLEDI